MKLKEVKEENTPPIKYRPTTRDELKEIVKQEIENQGGVNVDLRMVDVSKVTNISGVFCNCESLRSLNISNWDVSNVKYMIMTLNLLLPLLIEPNKSNITTIEL